MNEADILKWDNEILDTGYWMLDAGYWMLDAVIRSHGSCPHEPLFACENWFRFVRTRTEAAEIAGYLILDAGRKSYKKSEMRSQGRAPSPSEYTISALMFR